MIWEMRGHTFLGENGFHAGFRFFGFQVVFHLVHDFGFVC
jgi:hypothetical protein|tara:strand:+ start:15887 stop:16006 length:120 start_codon:yes stop_codon:yes gene_type:complete